MDNFKQGRVGGWADRSRKHLAGFFPYFLDRDDMKSFPHFSNYSTLEDILGDNIISGGESYKEQFKNVTFPKLILELYCY